MKRWETLTILTFSLAPLLPFNVVGMVAGVLRFSPLSYVGVFAGVLFW